jgi:histidyl-tRNA synthetase
MTEMSDESRSFSAPRGTRDILPPESWRWEQIIRLAQDLFAGAGYAPATTPTFEHTEVFQRGVGEASDVVTKHMYTFADGGGRSLTLRPEGTAPVMRAVLQHRLERGALPIKLHYAEPMFRQERPQKGRYREFFQLGIEAIGSDDPAVDAEVIEIGDRFLRAAGVHPTILLNSIGHYDRSCRAGYLEVLANFLREHRSELSDEDRDRVDTNPLRTFDSKESKTIAVMRDAPLITEYLCEACRKHFEDVQGLLKEVDVPFSLDARLVRGLDYYTRTAFEYVASDLGAQNAVGGGGRYDGLAEVLGGRSLPGIGFALGLDRILLSGEREVELPRPVSAYVVSLTDEARRQALKLATRLRSSGIGADLDLAGRAMKGQMKDAARSGARWAIILGDEELATGMVTLKDLVTQEQRRVEFERVVDEIAP